MGVFMCVDRGLCVSMGVYGSLWINMTIQVFIDICGGLWESMDKYKYTSVCEYLLEFVHVYGSVLSL